MTQNCGLGLHPFLRHYPVRLVYELLFPNCRPLARIIVPDTTRCSANIVEQMSVTLFKTQDSFKAVILLFLLQLLNSFIPVCCTFLYLSSRNVAFVINQLLCSMLLVVMSISHFGYVRFF